MIITDLCTDVEASKNNYVKKKKSNKKEFTLHDST